MHWSIASQNTGSTRWLLKHNQSPISLSTHRTDFNIGSWKKYAEQKQTGQNVIESETEESNNHVAEIENNVFEYENANQSDLSEVDKLSPNDRPASSSTVLATLSDSQLQGTAISALKLTTLAIASIVSRSS